MDALNEKWFNVRVFMNRVVEHRVFEGIILFLIAASSISLVSIHSIHAIPHTVR